MARERRTDRVRVQREVKIKKPLSGNMLFVIVGAFVIVSFYAGTRSDQIAALIGPLFGLKIYAEDIDLSSVQSTYKALKANYDGALDDKKLIEGANKGLVDAAGDEYTLYMNATESGDFDDDLSGNIGGGIGAEIGLRSNTVTIVRVLDDNPAAKAGLQANDKVIKINDQSAEGFTVEQAVSQIRGEVGTTVKLFVQRGSETKEFTVTRATVSNPSVTSNITDGIGILTISRFDSETGDLALAGANKFKAANVRGVIVDLRGNGGGYVDAAQDVAGLWLEDKVIVVEKANGAVVETVKSGRNAPLAGIKTAVLVNPSSASASEIVAGALQDYEIATLVGERTFGKGTVQKLVGLPLGAQLKVTVARWYTPDGKNITTDGISPNTVVGLTQADLDAGKDPQLDAAKDALK